MRFVLSCPVFSQWFPSTSSSWFSSLALFACVPKKKKNRRRRCRPLAQRRHLLIHSTIPVHLSFSQAFAGAEQGWTSLGRTNEHECYDCTRNLSRPSSSDMSPHIRGRMLPLGASMDSFVLTGCYSQRRFVSLPDVLFYAVCCSHFLSFSHKHRTIANAMLHTHTHTQTLGSCGRDRTEIPSDL